MSRSTICCVVMAVCRNLSGGGMVKTQIGPAGKDRSPNIGTCALQSRLRATTMHLHSSTRLLLLIFFLAASGCQRQTHVVNRGPAVPPNPTIKPLPENASPQLKQMLDGAIAQAGV